MLSTQKHHIFFLNMSQNILTSISTSVSFFSITYTHKPSELKIFQIRFIHWSITKAIHTIFADISHDFHPLWQNNLFVDLTTVYHSLHTYPSIIIHPHSSFVYTHRKITIKFYALSSNVTHLTPPYLTLPI